MTFCYVLWHNWYRLLVYFVITLTFSLHLTNYLIYWLVVCKGPVHFWQISKIFLGRFQEKLRFGIWEILHNFSMFFHRELTLEWIGVYMKSKTRYYGMFWLRTCPLYWTATQKITKINKNELSLSGIKIKSRAGYSSSLFISTEGKKTTMEVLTKQLYAIFSASNWQTGLVFHH